MIPETIYLQYVEGDDALWTDTTWCDARINDDDIVYDRRKTWISVEKRMPDPCVDVLLFDEFGIGGGAWYPYSGWITWGGAESKTVTHWMPLPRPPCGGHIEITDCDVKGDSNAKP
ncbi:MAG: DUF551 domain-containing protein [Rhodothermales bacterium]